MRFAVQQIIEFCNELQKLALVIFHFDLLDEVEQVFLFFRCHWSRPWLEIIARRSLGRLWSIPKRLYGIEQNSVPVFLGD